MKVIKVYPFNQLVVEVGSAALQLGLSKAVNSVIFISKTNP